MKIMKDNNDNKDDKDDKDDKKDDNNEGFCKGNYSGKKRGERIERFCRPEWW